MNKTTWNWPMTLIRYVWDKKFSFNLWSQLCAISYWSYNKKIVNHIIISMAWKRLCAFISIKILPRRWKKVGSNDGWLASLIFFSNSSILIFVYVKQQRSGPFPSYVLLSTPYESIFIQWYIAVYSLRKISSVTSKKVYERNIYPYFHY